MTFRSLAATSSTFSSTLSTTRSKPLLISRWVLRLSFGAMMSPAMMPAAVPVRNEIANFLNPNVLLLLNMPDLHRRFDAIPAPDAMTAIAAKRAINFHHDEHGSFWITPMIQNVSGERQNHLTRSREGREERDVDLLPDNLLASSLRVFAPSREKKVSTNPLINFLNDDRDAFWITPMIQNAPRFILDHPDDPPDHPDAILDHRDAILDARNPSSDHQRRLRPALERRNEAPDSILDSRDPACEQKLDTSDVLEGALDCIDVIQNASGCILNHRDDPKLHRGAILNHRDDPELHRDDPELMGEDAKPAREDAGTVLDGP